MPEPTMATSSVRRPAGRDAALIGAKYPRTSNHGILSPMPRVSTFAVLSLAMVLSLAACGAGAGGDGAPAAEPEPGHVALALTDTDPVSAAVDTSCTTTSVKGLSTQLVAEIQCMRPGSMKSIEGAAGLSLGSAVFPYLQTPAADALLAAQKARGATMSINSALRTLPQQYLLYRWYKAGRCGISLAAMPGKSNHEGAVARRHRRRIRRGAPAMTDAGFRWLGASDPVHFDFIGAGAIDLGGLSVTAFQRLWNRNHPEDPIAEDGDYGLETATRVARAPSADSPRGAEGCTTDASDAGAGPHAACCARHAPPFPTPPKPAPDRQRMPASRRAAHDRIRRRARSPIAILGLVMLGASARRRR